MTELARAKAQTSRPPAKPSIRALTIRAIHATWRKVARGVDAHNKEEMRAARLHFCTTTLGLKKPLASMRRLTPVQLGKVLDEMRRMERSPALPGMAGVQRAKSEEQGGAPLALCPSPPAEIFHLASEAQVTAIGKLFDFLQWGAEGRAGFIQSKFKKSNEHMLLFKEATSLTMILLTIAATRDIRSRTGAERVGRKMVMMAIPDLKRRLGIDQKPPSADFADYADEGEA